MRDLFGEMEQKAQTKTDGPEKVAKVVKSPKFSRTNKRLISAHCEIMDNGREPITYQHTVLCQTGLPYKPVKERVLEQEQGAVSLSVEAGRAKNPETGKWVDLPLPHGERPRLILMHLNTEALRTNSPVVEVEGSMTAFARRLGMDTSGPSLRTLKDQLGRLSAALVRMAVVENGRSVQVNTQIVGAFDLWFPKSEYQRVLWPSVIRLGQDYFNSLITNAVPLDERAIAALSGTSLGLDVYAWLSQRLHRIEKRKPQRITWESLKSQFGGQYGRIEDFRKRFKPVLKQVLTVYPGSTVGEWVEDGRSVGLVLHHSAPPVTKRMVLLPRQGDGVTIDATPIRVAID